MREQYWWHPLHRRPQTVTLSASTVVDCYQEILTVMRWQWQTCFPRRPFTIELWQSIEDQNGQRLMAPWSMHDLGAETPGTVHGTWIFTCTCTSRREPMSVLQFVASSVKVKKILVPCGDGCPLDASNTLHLEFHRKPGNLMLYGVGKA